MKFTMLMLLSISLLAVGLGGCSDTEPAAEPAKTETRAPAETPDVTTKTDNTSVNTGHDGSTGTASAVENVLAKDMFEHHRFELKTVDGVDYSSKERVPDLSFNEGFRVSGKICNGFSGQGELDGETLFVRQMVSTKMFCADQDLNTLEGAFATMLDKGATLTYDGRTLTLKGEGPVLVYELRDLVQ